MDGFTLVHGVSLAGLAALVACSVWTDMSSLRIPNTVCAGVVLLWVVYAATHLAAGNDPLILQSVLWAFVVLAGGFLIFCLNWMGAGDVKLIAALSLWAGPVLLPTFLFVTAITGGVISLGYLGFRHTVRRLSITPGVAVYIPRRWVTLVDAQTGAPIPYAMPIAAGSIVIFWALYQGLIGQDLAGEWLISTSR